MQKLFFTLSFVILYITISFAQAQVVFPITVANNLGAQITLYFGLDVTATDGIDEALGEAELPPIMGPPFDARLFLPPAFSIILSSYHDYRAPGNPPAFPFTGQKEHRLAYIPGDDPGATEIIISWNNLPSQVSGLFTDIITGNLINFTFSGTGSFTVTNPTAFNQLKMFINYTDITPVELTSFTANMYEQGVILNWTTATELNNQGFEIERSTVEQSWQKIGYIPGFGTTTEPKSYSFLDENVETGVYSYRLKQIDYDGTSTYTDAIEVEVDFTPNDFGLSQNYPNPFNPSTTIQFQVPKVSDVTIRIFDMLGQEVRTLFNEQVQPGSYTVEWNGLNSAGTKMSSGTYIYRMTSGEFTDVKEMIFLK